MTSKMNDISISWRGATGSVPATGVLPVVAKVEDIITVGELALSVQKQTVPLAKLSMAYGVILRAAGIGVSDDEVYSDMIAQQADPRFVMNAIMTLLMLILPSGDMRNAVVGALAVQAAQSGAEVPDKARKESSSRNSTKRRSSRKGG